MITQCQRKGCLKHVNAERSRGIRKIYCSPKCRIDVAQGRAERGIDRERHVEPPKTSWWQFGEDFYTMARRKFPEEPKMVTKGWGDAA